jgi:hypothetical protein
MKILPLILTAFPIAASLSIISPVQAESSSSCSAALETVQKTLQKKRSWAFVPGIYPIVTKITQKVEKMAM